MFFSTAPTNPFNDIREVMRAYPDWRLLHQQGEQMNGDGNKFNLTIQVERLISTSWLQMGMKTINNMSK